MTRRPFFLHSMLAFGFAFLYAPIAILIFFSFNESRLVTVWSGFSVRWYGELMRNEQMLQAAWLSFRIATVNATLAVILGTMAGIVLARYRRMRGHGLFAVLIAAPMVMPEVILGLSLLLLFIAMENLIGWPAGRGESTIVISHVTFTMAYVAVVVQAKLADFDESLEDAARDLGARPLTVFTAITLPLIAPALIAGWLLAFTLSFDDLVITSFVAGPGSSTLPMVVYSSVRLGVSPQINALATLIVIAVAVLITIAGWLLYRNDRTSRG